MNKRSRAAAQQQQNVLIPTPSVPWTQATPIVGGQRLTDSEMSAFPPQESVYAELENGGSQEVAFSKLVRSAGYSVFADFALVKDRGGRWHCMGIELKPNVKGNPRLYHYVSNKLVGPYTQLDPIAPGFPYHIGPDGIGEIVSPHVVWKDERTAYMVHGVRTLDASTGSYSSLRILKSMDDRLEVWKSRYPDAEQKNIITEEHDCRDPMILWDPDRRMFYLYYVVGGGGVESAEDTAVRVRTSTDLETWSAPRMLMATPPGYGNAESIFVLKRDSLYYLWVCGYDWGRMSLYISEDPLDFGDSVRNRIMEQSGHAPEIVYDNGQYWMACAGISSVFGRAWGICDLLGTYIQPLKWVQADDAALNKIIRK